MKQFLLVTAAAFAFAAPPAYKVITKIKIGGATRWDYGTFIGTLGLFTALFFLFVRFLPMIPMSEIRMMLPQAKITAEPEAMEAGD